MGAMGIPELLLIVALARVVVGAGAPGPAPHGRPDGARESRRRYTVPMVSTSATDQARRGDGVWAHLP